MPPGLSPPRFLSQWRMATPKPLGAVKVFELIRILVIPGLYSD